MLVLKKVAVTGGISCGKSTVCRSFKELGAYVVSADEIVHQLLSPNTHLGQKVIELLGSDIVVDHQIDRAKVAKKVFNQPSLLRSLENLTHPAVLTEIVRHYELAKQNRSISMFVVEIPLLFETGMDKLFDFDATIAIFADPAICRNRFNNMKPDASDYDQRAARQLPAEEKARRADYVILNNGTIPEMEAQARKIFEQIIKGFPLKQSSTI